MCGNTKKGNIRDKEVSYSNGDYMANRELPHMYYRDFLVWREGTTKLRRASINIIQNFERNFQLFISIGQGKLIEKYNEEGNREILLETLSLLINTM